MYQIGAVTGSNTQYAQAYQSHHGDPIVTQRMFVTHGANESARNAQGFGTTSMVAMGLGVAAIMFAPWAVPILFQASMATGVVASLLTLKNEAQKDNLDWGTINLEIIGLAGMLVGLAAASQVRPGNGSEAGAPETM